MSYDRIDGNGTMHIVRLLRREVAYHLRELAREYPPHVGELLLLVARRCKAGVYHSEYTAQNIARIIGGDRPIDGQARQDLHAAESALKALRALGW